MLLSSPIINLNFTLILIPEKKPHSALWYVIKTNRAGCLPVLKYTGGLNGSGFLTAGLSFNDEIYFGVKDVKHTA